ncbi:conserved hypothetical protein [Candidatus Magnetomoraceae bacterium gMMP-15]
MSDLISTVDAVKLLQDEKLMDEVINQVVDDPVIMADLAEDMADELSDLIEDDPVFKQKLMTAAMATPNFKKMILKSLVKELDD